MESVIERRERRLLESTTKNVGEHYETGLLWKYDEVVLPNSLPMAKRRWLCLEKRMQMDADLEKNLVDRMRDYARKGYARKLTLEESKLKTSRTWYLPVFSVTNPNRPGKIRMVWDAAAKVSKVSSIYMDRVTSKSVIGYQTPSKFWKH